MLFFKTIKNLRIKKNLVKIVSTISDNIDNSLISSSSVVTNAVQRSLNKVTLRIRYNMK
jgi:hypothetical protein